MDLLGTLLHQFYLLHHYFLNLWLVLILIMQFVALLCNFLNITLKQNINNLIKKSYLLVKFICIMGFIYSFKTLKVIYCYSATDK
jgi:hypothetical protein